MLQSTADSEDAVSEVFIKYISAEKEFKDDEHKKAWLIRVAVNTCKNMLKFYRLRNYISLEDAENYCKTSEEKSILTEVLNLPEKYRTVIYLYYAEGYKTGEIAQMLSISPAAARKRLQYGRDMLRLEYGKDAF